jgi:alpha-amylase
MIKREFEIPGWARQTNIYEVNLRQYTADGTIRAFEKELPRLKEMGIQTLWFMPLTPIAKKNRKGKSGSYYACSDYYSIDAEFGTEEDFIQLVQQAHKAGFKVIIDWVANHTGWDHNWTHQHPEFYKIDPATGIFKMASGMEDIIELDFDNSEMRLAMIDAMQYWVSTFEIDGFRCDLAFWVSIDFWKQARAVLDKDKPLFWLGEFDLLDHPEYGEIFDAYYTWSWMHAAQSYYTGNLNILMLEAVLKKHLLSSSPCIPAWFTSNHDENSWNGTEYEKYGDMAIPLAVFSMTFNGLPLLYSGQELPNKKRLAFFEKDPIEWTGEYELEQFYRKFLLLHQEHPALRANDPSVKRLLEVIADQPVLMYLFIYEEQFVLVMLNLGAGEAVIEKIEPELPAVCRNFITGELWDGKIAAMQMAPWSFAVFCEA